MAQVKEAKPFSRGISTSPDVEKLIRKFGAPKAGVIPWREVERTIGLIKQSSRFWSVTIAWRRKLLEEYNIATGTVPGEGLRVYDEDERVYTGASMLHKSVRALTRAHEWSLRIDDSKLDGPSKKRLNHVLKAGKAIVTIATDNVRALVEAAPSETPSKPKLLKR